MKLCKAMDAAGTRGSSLPAWKHSSRSKVSVIPCRCNATLGKLADLQMCPTSVARLLPSFSWQSCGNADLRTYYTWIPLTWGNAMWCDYATKMKLLWLKCNSLMQHHTVLSLYVHFMFTDTHSRMFRGRSCGWGEMKCAIWLWNEEQAAEFLKEVCEAKVTWLPRCRSYNIT